jgi:hypothetical protein
VQAVAAAASEAHAADRLAAAKPAAMQHKTANCFYCLCSLLEKREGSTFLDFDRDFSAIGNVMLQHPW